VSLAVHAVNALLLFLLFRRMTGELYPSAFVAFLFALHPLHVESVAWASERKDVLSTCFWILATWAYVRYAERPAATRYLAVVGLLALGLLSKPMLVTLPLTLFLLDVWPLGRLPIVAGRERGVGLGRLVLEKVPLLVVAAASGAVTFAVQRAAGAMAPIEGLPLAARAVNAVVSCAAYIGTALWPAGSPSSIRSTRRFRPSRSRRLSRCSSA